MIMFKKMSTAMNIEGLRKLESVALKINKLNFVPHACVLSAVSGALNKA